MPGAEKIVYSLLCNIRTQEYIKRKNDIMRVNNSAILKNFKYPFRQILFYNFIRDYLSFERLVL